MQDQDIKTRMRNRMHAMLQEFAACTGRYPDEAREELKDELKKRGMIKESTKELDIRGLAIAGNIVGDWINKNRLPL